MTMACTPLLANMTVMVPSPRHPCVHSFVVRISPQIGEQIDGTWDAIRARRNVRSYTTRPVAEEQLTRIAEAGWRAPSASNWQHWDFVLVTDPGQLAELATVWQGRVTHVAGELTAIDGAGVGCAGIAPPGKSASTRDCRIARIVAQRPYRKRYRVRPGSIERQLEFISP